VWYIGTDRNLYCAQNIHFVWGLSTTTSTLFWPQADEPNGALGVTSDFTTSQIRIYYYVKGVLTEIKFDKDGAWKQAEPVPTFNATAEVSTPSDTGNSTAPPTQTPDPGLSPGAKAGIGVGVTLGALAVFGVLGALFFFRRRNNLRQQAAAETGPAVPEMAGTAAPVLYDAHGNPVHDPRYASPSAYGGSPPPGYVWEQKDAHQLDGAEVPQELEGPRAFYELPDQAYSHELVGDGRVGHELPGDGVSGGRGGVDGNGKGVGSKS
jgi:hypothetical protein